MWMFLRSVPQFMLMPVLSQGFTLIEAVSHAFLRDSGGVIYTSRPICVRFCLICTQLQLLLYRITVWLLCNFSSATLIRAQYILKMAS